MTAIQLAIARLDGLVAPRAPAARLGVLRILVAGFVLVYVAVRLPVFVALADRRPETFDGIGVAAPFGSPLPDGVLYGLLAIVLVSAALAAVGWRYRVVGPVFGLSVLALLTYRSSFGQILWFEIVFALHAPIVGLAPAADARSLDARGRIAPRASPAYGWPVRLAALVTVITYLLSGVSKLRIGGLDWVFGDSLRNHVAFSAARLEVFGARSSPLADSVVGWVWLAPVLAAAALLLELGAPLALLGGRIRTVWVVGTWLMHLMIALSMFIVFPYPLFGVAFAPLYALEDLRPPDRRR